MLKPSRQQQRFEHLPSLGGQSPDPADESWIDTWTERQQVEAHPEGEERVQAIVDGLSTAFHMRIRWHMTELSFIVEAVRNHVHHIYGFESIEDYLCFHLGEGYYKTCEKVNIALMLEELVAARKAYAQGEISWDHLRALVRVATCENEEQLVEIARKNTVAKTFKVVNKIAALDEQDSAETRRQRYLNMRVDKVRRTVNFWGELPEEQGQVLKKAIDALAKEVPDDANADGEPTPVASKRADALYELAASALNDKAPASTVLIHIDASAVSSESSHSRPLGQPTGSYEDGTPVPPGVASRLLCDSAVQLVIDDDQKAPLGLGRRRRTVNSRLRQGLMNRDRGCAWHGCRRVYNLQAHHLVSWVDGGPTDYENLVLLCQYHHHAVHEGGFRLRGSPGDLQIYRPNGQPMPVGPPPGNTQIREAFRTQLQLVGGARPYGGPKPGEFQD